jgi:hypothetical protein
VHNSQLREHDRSVCAGESLRTTEDDRERGESERG